MTINLHDETDKLSESLKETIISAAKAAVKAEGITKPCSVDILIVDIPNMQEINKAKRGIDVPTDVLSFPAEEGFSGILFLGDIVICYEKIFSQAKDYAHTIEREAGFLTAHAMLHCMGYDHENPEDEKEMLAMQELILGKMGLRR
ncbi:MAG: rRNA maturation RNase YbeY [Defluviitaleaceae bacterium]|nr:rRNA maturation RNase YbeY [Defluviitaleaceae bacterium]